MNYRQSKIFADGMLLLVAFFWGATFVLVQQAINKVPVFTFLGIRFLLAAFLLWLFQLFYHHGKPARINRKTLASGVMIGLWLFAGYAFQTFGLLSTTPAKAGFITGLNVVLVPLFSFWILKQHIRLFTIAGILLATIGLGILSVRPDFSLGTGDTLVFFSAIAFAMQITFTGKYASACNSLDLAIIQISTVGFFSMIAGFLFEPWKQALRPAIMLDPEVWIAIVIVTIFATCYAFFAQTYFQQYTTTSHAALIFMSEPVFAAITSWIWIHEPFTVKTLSGSFFILVGMLISECSGFFLQRQKQPIDSELS